MKFPKLKLKSLCTLHFALCTILSIGAFLRFYGLNWGLPYPFHPDERNMAVAITRFSSKNLNPEFYAYGQFPLYLTYFSSQILSFWLPEKFKETLTFNQAVIFLRFWSGLFSTATIYIVYLISKKIFSLKKLCTLHFALCTATAVAFTPGLIQSAHFGTTESILTFCFISIVFFSLKILESPNFSNFFWAAFFLGIALGSKISAAVFCVPLIFATTWQFRKLKAIGERLRLILKFIFTLSFTLTLTILVSPYIILAYEDSRGILLYEISVAQGKQILFYTRQFIDTIPVLFQVQKILPFALGWPIFSLGTLGFLVMIINLIRKKGNQKLTSYFLLLTSYLIYFLPNAFLFTKWTRFMTPTLPFFSIFAAFFLSNISYSKKFLFVLTTLAIIPGLVFSTIYFKPDIRFIASDWIYKNIPSGSHILSETANVVDIPIRNPNYQLTNYSLNPVSFGFYSLDENPKTFQKLLDELTGSDYIFIPSRRLFANHLRLPEKYPLTAKYYQLLFSGKLGFEKIKEFKILNDESAEETWTVFDHPVIKVYKKVIHYNKLDYERLFED